MAWRIDTSFHDMTYFHLSTMKVLKFGGTSVGTASSLRNVKDIIESNDEQPIVVVVSALGGITDRLIATARTAADGNLEYIVSYAEIVKRHLSLINEIIPEDKRRDVTAVVNTLLEELGNIYRGISLVKDLSQRTLDVVVSYGERLSSFIISNYISGAILVDSRRFIITKHRHGSNVLDVEETDSQIARYFGDCKFKIAVCPGFISSDRSGDITNLGRGGSDFTAAILAAALNASILEIWTDVDGFMTADPRMIADARVLKSMSFSEAMELCNNGAKVVYPPTIYPVFRRNIPIVVKNTFKPSAPGTIIVDSTAPSTDATVKGISSISPIALLSLEGSGVENVENFSGRIFEALTREDISPLLVSLVFNRNRVLVALRPSDSSRALELLTDRFLAELQDGLLSEISCSDEYAAIAVVGDNMRHTPGIVGRLNLALQKCDILPEASSQGATENKCLFIVNRSQLQSAMRQLHTTLFTEHN